MPYFPEHNVLFIHIPKNAGRYINKILGLPDELWNEKEIKKIKKRQKIGRLLIRLGKYIVKKIVGIPPYMKNRELSAKYLFGAFGGEYYFSHISLWEIINYKILSKEILDKCIILAVHRHPVDRLISIYKFWELDKYFTFDEFVDKINKKNIYFLKNFGLLMHIRTQLSFVKDAEPYTSKVYWLSFENLEEDLKKFIKKHNLNVKFFSHRIGASPKKLIKYKENTIWKIYEEYKEDFKFFNYSISDYIKK